MSSSPWPTDVPAAPHPDGFLSLLFTVRELVAVNCVFVTLYLLQDLALLQPWCPGVTASTAMQRTMAVHSNQHATILSSSSSSGWEVLDIMAASLSAMWEAGGGDNGLKPFVADRLQFGPIMGGMRHQMQADMKKVSWSYRGVVSLCFSSCNMIMEEKGLQATGCSLGQLSVINNQTETKHVAHARQSSQHASTN